MYKTRLCMGLSPAYGISYEEQIRMLSEIGFDGFFSGWSRDMDIATLRRTADEVGMVYQSIHAPFVGVHKLWHVNNETESMVANLIDCVRDCAKYDVPIMVVHAFIGFELHSPTPDGIANFERVVAEAARCGVRIAFENTEGEEYLAALMEHFRGNTSVGFCWDTGHEMCYNHKDMLSLYGDRLICTHINDNLGTKDFNGKITSRDDLHLLPFDGIGDWRDITARMNAHGYDDFLTFELKVANQKGRHENDVYARMDIYDYFVEAYKRACRVAVMKNGWM